MQDGWEVGELLAGPCFANCEGEWGRQAWPQGFGVEIRAGGCGAQPRSAGSQLLARNLARAGSGSFLFS